MTHSFAPLSKPTPMFIVILVLSYQLSIKSVNKILLSDLGTHNKSQAADGYSASAS